MRVVETDSGYEEITEDEYYEGWYAFNEDRTEDVWEGAFD